MQLTVLGSNGTYPTAGRPAAGYLVTEGETTLWMDAGPGTYLALCGEMEPRNLTGVFLSHRHLDHCSDIFALYHAIAYGDRKVEPIPVLCPKGLPARLADMAGGLGAAFEFVTLASGDTITLGAMNISVTRTNHPPPTLSPRIVANGRSLTYTADTGPSPLLEEHAANSDILLAEATLSEPRRDSTQHMTGLEAGRMAARAKVRRLVLTHIAPYLDPEKSLMEAESAYNGRVSLAVPGRRIRI